MAKKNTLQSAFTDAGQPVYLPLNQLQFDPNNPRIVEQIGAKPTQADIFRLLTQGEMRATELVPSFVENGYIPYEPLIVRQQGAKFTVLEGNRRLAALRTLEESEDPEERAAFAQHKLQRVPCLVFTGDEKQLLAYLGLRHLSKTKDWSTNAKGNFVERILESGLKLPEAAKITNTTTSSLRLILLTRRMFEQAENLGLSLPNANQAEGETLFWHLGDALRRTHTKNYLSLEENDNPLEQPTFDETNFERLVTWIYGSSKTKQRPLITSIRDIPILNDCLGNERAAKSLEGGSTLEEAAEEMQLGGARVTSHLERARKSIQRGTGELSGVDKAGCAEVEVSFEELTDAVEQFEASLKIRKGKLKIQ